MKIAICFHLGYISRWVEFTSYIDTVMQYCPNTDLYITYREDRDITAMCLKKYPNAKILKVSRGADTAPFLLQIKALLASKIPYDYVLKLHTKSNNRECPTWLTDLTEEILGSVHKVSQVFDYFQKIPKLPFSVDVNGSLRDEWRQIRIIQL